MRISAKTRKDIERHAMGEYVEGRREACGLIVAAGDKPVYVPCRNIAENGQDFEICPDDQLRAEAAGEIVAIVHSHVDQGPEPSALDLVECERHGLPWHIVAVGTDAGEEEPRILGWKSFKPTGFVAPLVGRTFIHGSLDCYGLIRDFYARELGIDLPDFVRPDDWWLKEEYGELYLENFERAGFVRVDDGPRYADVPLMQNRSDRVNHGGVYLGGVALKTEPGLHQMTDAMLHHSMPRLSERVVYSGPWRDATRLIVRHRSLM